MAREQDMRRTRKKHNGALKAKVSLTATNGVGKRFFGTKPPDLIRGRAECRALVERENPVLPVSQQCQLLAVFRSSIYRLPAEVSDQDRAIMALIDRHYLVRPYYDSRRMAAWLLTQGRLVNEL